MADLSFVTLFSFITTCFIIELTPGPNMAYLAILSASDGRKCGFAATAGVALGLLIVGLGATLGMAALIANSFWAYESLRWCGVLYLLWLAYEGWRVKAGMADIDVEPEQNLRKFFRRGLITNLLNPKAAIFYITILPGFIDASPKAEMQGLTLTFIYVSVATLVHSSLVLVAGAAEDFLNDPVRERRARRIMSMLLAAVALWLGLSTGRDFS